MQQQLTTNPVGRLPSQVHSVSNKVKQQIPAGLIVSVEGGQNVTWLTRAQSGWCPEEMQAYTFPPHH